MPNKNTYPEWNIAELTGYQPKTTFWQDFSIADQPGSQEQKVAAVKDTFNRAFSEWKGNHIYLTELVMVLNWKIHLFFNDNNELAKLYEDLFRQADDYACNNLKGEELDYFLRTTD